MHIGDNGDALMTLFLSNLIHAEIVSRLRHRESRNPTPYSALHDVTDSIPAQPELPAYGIHRAGFQPGQNKSFKQECVTTAGACPGNRKDLTAMLWTLNSGKAGLNHGGELTGIQMTPFPVAVILHRA